LNFQNVRIKTINIVCFAGKKNLSLYLGEGTNLFIGQNSCGKTTVCDFIRFIMYGSEGMDTVFPWSGEKTVSGELGILADGAYYRVHRTESLPGAFPESSCTVTDRSGLTVVTESTPGEYFFGCNSFVYDRTLYCAQKQTGRIQQDISADVLDKWALAFSGKGGLYSALEKAEKERGLLMNENKTGELDKLLDERSRAEKLTVSISEKERARDEAIKNAEDIQSKIDANNKRMVIIKANMKNYTDDIKLMENRENAQTLKNDIAQYEKKSKLLLFDANSVHPGVNKEKYSRLADEYLEYSRLEASRAEIRSRLDLTRDNKETKKALFDVKGADAEEVEDAQSRIDMRHGLKNVFAALFTLFTIVAVFAFCFLWLVAKKDLLFSGLIAGGVFLMAIALLVASRLCGRSIKKIIASFGLETQTDFDDLYRMTTDFIKSDEEDAKLLEEEQASYDKVDSQVNAKLSSLRKLIGEEGPASDGRVTEYSVSESGELSASGDAPAEDTHAADVALLEKVDTIIRKYGDYFENEKELEKMRLSYKELLSRDVKRDTLEISEEFLMLERELSFLSKQNGGLMAKKAECEKRAAELADYAENARKASLDAKKNDVDVLEKVERYRSIQLRCDDLTKEISALEDSVTQPVSARVNALISFALKQDESFILSDKFEFKYKRGSRTMPFTSAGGGLSELALIALRIAFVEQLVSAKVPMVFDESFIFIDRENTDKLCRILESSGRQFLIFSSSEADSPTPTETSVVFTTEKFESR